MIGNYLIIGNIGNYLIKRQSERYIIIVVIHESTIPNWND